eukprot:GHVL01043171.1.p1 GENE.GHVL01043171.1~~GHVL01043171.1.p1  ORF type:complete len:192 (+),score=18.84 GHVL01043171.1:395-970(+)
MLSCMSLTVPTVFQQQHGVSETDVLLVSRICAIVIIVTYFLFLFFQLKTHLYLFQSDDEDEAEETVSAGVAMALLTFVAILVSVNSEGLVGSIQGVTKTLGMREDFIGIILIPIVGNAAEHVTAVTCAMKNKLDLALGVAAGSSVQIALLVVPFSVLLGWALDQPMSMSWEPLQCTILVLSVSSYVYVCYL